MMRSLVCLPFCLVLFLFCHTSETSQRSLNCCLKTGTDKIPDNRVVDYADQKAGLCPINAVVLWTTRGKAKCYEPGSEWIECIKSKVDQKKMSKQTSDPTAVLSQNKKQKNGKGCKKKQISL
ncbi:C-C motif chemokine 32b.3 [Megalobrama amblycephala]|uniref:C-C motif chemokine 32b.3 n=1 Tax=Megalobrama amblycephala TaxID=75352 RepID=UPI002014038A|nr:C-C motif chemokine 32b.3 [Megalobrama amblycephala]